MSDHFVCRTKEINNTRPCFSDEHGHCTTVTIQECGLDLEGIPENEATEKYFQAARVTGLSSILSMEDSLVVAKKTVPAVFDRDHFRPAADFYKNIYQRNLLKAAKRFMTEAEAVLQKMRATQRDRKPQVDRPEPHVGPLR